jgi:hypothetical protein
MVVVLSLVLILIVPGTIIMLLPPWPLERKLKIFGLVIIFAGLVVQLLDQIGCLQDADKLALAKRIYSQSGGIPKDAAGFEKFLRAFPPPPGVDKSAITHIVKDQLQTHDAYPIAITLRYLAGPERTTPVATYQEVRAWAESTRYSWWSLSIAVVGLFLAAFLESREILKSKKKI